MIARSVKKRSLSWAESDSVSEAERSSALLQSDSIPPNLTIRFGGVIKGVKNRDTKEVKLG